jgi:hypothetical protein
MLLPTPIDSVRNLAETYGIAMRAQADKSEAVASAYVRRGGETEGSRLSKFVANAPHGILSFSGNANDARNELAGARGQLTIGNNMVPYAQGIAIGHGGAALPRDLVERQEALDRTIEEIKAMSSGGPADNIAYGHALLGGAADLRSLASDVQRFYRGPGLPAVAA